MVFFSLPFILDPPPPPFQFPDAELAHIQALIGASDFSPAEFERRLSADPFDPETRSLLQRRLAAEQERLKPLRDLVSRRESALYTLIDADAPDIKLTPARGTRSSRYCSPLLNCRSDANTNAKNALQKASEPTREAEKLLTPQALRKQMSALRETRADKVAEEARTIFQAKVKELEQLVLDAPTPERLRDLSAARVQLNADNAAFVERRSRQFALDDALRADSPPLKFAPVDANALARQRILAQSALERETAWFSSKADLTVLSEQLKAKQVAGKVFGDGGLGSSFGAQCCGHRSHPLSLGNSSASRSSFTS